MSHYLPAEELYNNIPIVRDAVLNEPLLYSRPLVTTKPEVYSGLFHHVRFSHMNYTQKGNRGTMSKTTQPDHFEDFINGTSYKPTFDGKV